MLVYEPVEEDLPYRQLTKNNIPHTKLKSLKELFAQKRQVNVITSLPFRFETAVNHLHPTAKCSRLNQTLEFHNIFYCENPE